MNPVHHRRIGHTGNDAIDPDIVLRQLQRCAFIMPITSVFGRGVGGRVGERR